MSNFPRVASFKTVERFRERLRELGLPIDADDAILKAPESPLAEPLSIGEFHVGNRWAIHPMEGWDAEADGKPSELVHRRWRNFGISGAKWIWGGEAMAVVPEGRANPNQLIINQANRDALARLHEDLIEAHRARFGSADDFFTGFQLTHSGRFCKPFEKDKAEPKILYRHPILDQKFGLGPDYPLLGDDEIRRIIDACIEGAKIAESCGAQFVDIKHCHGYLGHEFLSAFTRPGPYGGPLENRTRFLREIVEGVQANTKLLIGVRLSLFDLIPFRPDPNLSEGTKLGPGIPAEFEGSYASSFGADAEDPSQYDLRPAIEFLAVAESLGVKMINVSAGSPYYNPHVIRPALFPPSDGYQPPEDPLVGCARQMEACAAVKARFPNLVFVGSAYTYFQEFLPQVAQWAVRTGGTDAVGMGRMVLSYPELPADSLERAELQTKRLCRTFSDCTTGPRKGLVSGCYPLDPFYKARPEAAIVKKIKASL
ncbi:MAG: NADH:flavin oxidoreductase [Acidobacteria bacterium]|nr:NADH:flavin oxidoreductase [Acidobacteriota bacterium]MDA1235415.1 NADH:flavin oxidoreductase [Acidobacteriota bacterium]